MGWKCNLFHPSIINLDPISDVPNCMQEEKLGERERGPSCHNKSVRDGGGQMREGTNGTRLAVSQSNAAGLNEL